MFFHFQICNLQADCEISTAHFQSAEQIIKPAERAKLRNKAQPAHKEASGGNFSPKHLRRSRCRIKRSKSIIAQS